MKTGTPKKALGLQEVNIGAAFGDKGSFTRAVLVLHRAYYVCVHDWKLHTVVYSNKVDTCSFSTVATVLTTTAVWILVVPNVADRVVQSC